MGELKTIESSVVVAWSSTTLCVDRSAGSSGNVAVPPPPGTLPLNQLSGSLQLPSVAPAQEPFICASNVWPLTPIALTAVRRAALDRQRAQRRDRVIAYPFAVSGTQLDQELKVRVTLPIVAGDRK